MTRKEYKRNYYQKHKEEINAKSRLQYQASAEIREKRKRWNREYYLANKDRIKKQAERRRAIQAEMLKKQLGGMKL